MSFFGGSNPFATKVGQLIEQSTDGNLVSENWGMYMEICDTVNETEEGPKDAIKAIKRRLTTNTGKNFKVIMYTLTVLETCVKNCGKRFHIFVANKDFLQELIKIIGPKNDPPQVVQEKVLSLIQTWADAFQGIPDLKEVGKVYQDLKNKGIEFPMTDLDHMAPIHTPARSAPETENRTPQRAPSTRAPQPAAYPPQPQPAAYPPPPQSYPPQAYPPGGGQMMPPPQPAPPIAGGPVFLTPDQLAKLRSELDTVQQNCNVFSEMLTEMNSPNEDPSDLDLLHELNNTCRQMQKRLVSLLEQVQNEQVTEELLHINDELNNVFLRYDRYERLCVSTQPQGTPVQPPQQPAAMPTAAVPAPLPPPVSVSRSPAPPPAYNTVQQPATANLINFDDPTPPPQQPSPAGMYPPTDAGDLSSQLAGMNVGISSVSNTLGQLNATPASTTGVASPAAEEDFDMFAQSRQAFDQNKQNPVGNTYDDQQTDQFSGGLGGALSAKTTNTPQDQEEDMLEVGGKMNEMDEMEKWLDENTGGAGGPETATSSEFDQFLAQRAREVDQMPDVPASQSSPANGGRGGRQMQKDDQENALFSL